jgi:hypothetical protein
MDGVRLVSIHSPPSSALARTAHEIEHVIEQLDGVALAARAEAHSTHRTNNSYESERAREAGRFVAREVHEGRGHVVSSVPG